MLPAAAWLSSAVVMDFLTFLTVLFMTNRVCQVLKVLQKTILKVVNGCC